MPNFPPAAGRFGDTRKKRHEQETAKGFCHGFLSAGRSLFYNLFYDLFLISPLSVLHQAVLYTVFTPVGNAFFLCRFCKLAVVKICVKAFLCHQLIMCSALHNTAVIDIHNLIAVADRRQTMRNDK